MELVTHGIHVTIWWKICGNDVAIAFWTLNVDAIEFEAVDSIDGN